MLRIECNPGKVREAITLPGSKSISNRVVLLNHITRSGAEIHNLSDSEDTKVLVRALQMIGSTDHATLDIGQAGTDMRFLTAYLSTVPGTWILTGSQRMKKRPVAPLVNALVQLGASIEYLEEEGFPPLKVTGSRLRGGEVSVDPTVSSQFVSALLLISPLLPEPLTLNLTGKAVSRPYISMTLGLLRLYGYSSIASPEQITVSPAARKRKLRSFDVESDWSAASYFYSICALSDDSSLELRNLKRKSLQADAAVARIYRRLGVQTTYRADSVLIAKKGIVPRIVEFDFSDCPDIAQTVMVTCFGLGIEGRFTGLATLRIKETDRLEAMRHELEKLGAEVELSDQKMIIRKSAGNVIKGFPQIETYDDHRMAMSFAPLVVKTGRLFITEPDVVAKSYPGFWQDLQALGFTVILQP